MSYAWGHNKFGQLGRERDRDYRPEKKEWIANRPSSNLYFKNITFIKSVCGPNYTLFLTNDGYIYAFGDNLNGQVGNGRTLPQFRPIRINEEIRFKDIITHFANDLSIGISTDGQYYIWGLANNIKVLSPQLIPESGKDSVFTLYAKSAKKKITFKTIIFNETKVINQSLIEFKCGENSYENRYNQMNVSTEDNSFVDEFCQSLHSEQSTAFDNLSVRSSVQSSRPSTALKHHLNLSFDNPLNSDLKFRSEDKVIYCHKTILQIRNPRFWQILSEQIIEDKNEIKINGEKFQLFYSFLQYLYGIEPEFNEKIVYDLQAMAQHFDEMDLLDDCSQYIQQLENTPNMSNVCQLYEKAIRKGSPDLELRCVEFVANNWKQIVSSDEFHAMNDSLSKRLMISAINSK